MVTSRSLRGFQLTLELGFLGGSCSGSSFPGVYVKPSGCCADVGFQVFCAQPAVISFCDYFISAKPFENGQYLDIYGITRDQAGEYECSAENDVSVPDVRKVKVTVNCKSRCLLLPQRGGEAAEKESLEQQTGAAGFVPAAEGAVLCGVTWLSPRRAQQGASSPFWVII